MKQLKGMVNPQIGSAKHKRGYFEWKTLTWILTCCVVLSSLHMHFNFDFRETVKENEPNKKEGHNNKA